MELNAQPALTNGPSVTIQNHSVSQLSNNVDSELASKPSPVVSISSSSVPPSTVTTTAIPNANPPTVSKEEAMIVDSELKSDIKPEISDSLHDEKRLNSLEVKQDVKKVDNIPEKDEDKMVPKVLMKPPISYIGPRDLKPKGSDKKEPVYLVISVLNDLHLVADLMKAKIGKEEFHVPVCTLSFSYT